MSWRDEYKSKLVSLEEAAKYVKSGDSIWVSPCSATPIDLVNTLINRYEELENVVLHSGLLLYPIPLLADPKYKGHIKYHAFFFGPAERKTYPLGNIGATSVHFSNLNKYIKDVAKANVVMADVSEPDEDGYMYYGAMGVSLSGAVAEYADKIIVQVNKHQPKVRGEYHRVHVSEVSCITEKDHKLPELPQPPVSETDNKIAELLVPLIPNGATLQIGLGGLANAVGYGLENKKDLSVHTEMITDSMMHLAKKGVINGKIVAGFALGSNELYKFAGESEQVYLKPIHLVNNVNSIAENDKFVSINACLMVDITGQVASEGVGTRIVSGTGGASDFVRGAASSKGGKSFICLPSVTEVKGKRISNIVAGLAPGTPVTIQRSDVQYIVTEYGIADVYNKSIEDRVKALIEIAHPDFKASLTEDAKKAGFIK